MASEKPAPVSIVCSQWFKLLKAERVHSLIIYYIYRFKKDFHKLERIKI
jgi:hypothetical protein